MNASKFMDARSKNWNEIEGNLENRMDRQRRTEEENKIKEGREHMILLYR